MENLKINLYEQGRQDAISQISLIISEVLTTFIKKENEVNEPEKIKFCKSHQHLLIELLGLINKLKE